MSVRSLWVRLSKGFMKRQARRKGVRFGSHCEFLSAHFGSEPYLVSMGDRVKTTTGVRFITHDGAVFVLRNMFPELRDADIARPIKIGSNVFIGVNTVVLPGTTIGDNTVVGAGSVVTGTFRSGVVIAGVPAREICGIEEYLEKNRDRIVHTKGMSPEEKRRVFLEMADRRAPGTDAPA